MRKQIPLALTVPTGSATVTLYEETDESASLARAQFNTLSYRSENNQTYTLNLYARSAAADTFVLITTDTVSASSAGNPRWKRWNLAALRMIKVEVVNGGTNQTTWKPTLEANSDDIGCC